MTQKPLLFFPSKEEATRSKLNGGGGNYSYPSSARQGQRLSPMFQQLSNSLNAQNVRIQQAAIGLDPEQVLVFEIIGSVEDFAKSVAKIEGFEWLGEIEIEDIAPDNEFYPINNSRQREDKPMNGRLYLVFTNITAMNQLLSLWNLWVNTPNFDCKQGIHRGKAKFKEVFKLLKNIRKWDVQDRFEESHILELWEETLQINPDQVIRFEIELWYRSNPIKRNESFQSVSRLVHEVGGQIITSCDIPEIHYHAILAELPAIEIRNILANSNTALIKCEYIMYFKPSGQIVMNDDYSAEDMQNIEEENNLPLPTGNPVIAIFDGFPLSRHEVLDGRLIIDDPDNMEAYYQVEERKHGTAMCSLIVRGDLNSNEEPLPTPLYVRPIMRPCDFGRVEFVPNDSLLIDTIHRAVKRMFEGENEIEAVANNVKIINLSIGDKDRLFYNLMSPWGKLLDWLSYKYNILFIISTGNHPDKIHLNISQVEFERLDTIEKEKIILHERLNNGRNFRIMSPSESINNLTVGALHADNATFLLTERRINPYTTILPSTYTAIGGGYRRAIKPDLVNIGGRLMYNLHNDGEIILTPSSYKVPPGLKVAAPDNTLNKTIYETGTSNAAALTTRSGYYCYQVLEELMNDTGINIPSNIIAILIKAMLVHGCSWSGIEEEIERRLEISDRQELQKIKMKLLGNGFPDINKVKECTEQRATVIGFGELNEEEAHVYNLPLPPSLASQTVKRRLTITLAWFSPISPTTQRYRTSRLWFEANNQLVSNRVSANWQAVRRGTLQHEIFEGSNATAFIDGESINIKINCSKDANSFLDRIPYALLVSMEVAEGIDLPIYQEIKERITIPVAIEQPIVG